MVKHETSPALGLTPNLPLGQLPHVNSTSATVMAGTRPPCLTRPVARDAHSSPGDLTTLGRRTQPLPLKPIRCSAFVGFRVNFVSDAAGGVASDVTGPEPGGALPVHFRRVNEGAPRSGRGLGRGLYLRRPQPHRRRPGHDLEGRGGAARLQPPRSRPRLRPARRRARPSSVIRRVGRCSRRRAGRRARARLLTEATTHHRAALRAALAPLAGTPVIN